MSTKARKTTDVAEIKRMVNFHLANRDPKFSTPESRRAMYSLLEAVLMSTGNYKGFRYRYSEWDVERRELKPGYDETRRAYY